MTKYLCRGREINTKLFSGRFLCLPIFYSVTHLAIKWVEENKNGTKIICKPEVIIFFRETKAPRVMQALLEYPAHRYVSKSKNNIWQANAT